MPERLIISKKVPRWPIRRIRSRYRRKNHLVIVGDFENDEDAKRITTAIKMAIHKENRREKTISYDMHWDIKV